MTSLSALSCRRNSRCQALTVSRNESVTSVISTSLKPAAAIKTSRGRVDAIARGPRRAAVRCADLDNPGVTMIVRYAVRPAGRSALLHALSTESLGRSQQSTSVCTMVSTHSFPKGRWRAEATMAPNEGTASSSARRSACCNPSMGRSVRTTSQPVRLAR